VQFSSWKRAQLEKRLSRLNDTRGFRVVVEKQPHEAAIPSPETPADHFGVMIDLDVTRIDEDSDRDMQSPPFLGEGCMYAVVRETTYPADKLLGDRPEFRTVQNAEEKELETWAHLSATTDFLDAHANQPNR
jgi:hypothetical protein